MVGSGNTPPMSNPFREMAQLHVQNGSLDIVQQSGLPMVVIFARRTIFAVIAEECRHAGKRRIVRGNGAPVSEPAEHFEWIEAEATRAALASGALAVEGGPERLSRILDHPQTMSVSDGIQPVARLARQGVHAGERTKGRQHADLRAEDVRSVWPERLQMTLLRGGERVALHTRLCGTHWVPAVLGTVGGGLAAGMTLAECAQALASVEPFDGRMQPVTTPGGVTFFAAVIRAIASSILSGSTVSGVSPSRPRMTASSPSSSCSGSSRADANP